MIGMPVDQDGAMNHNAFDSSAVGSPVTSTSQQSNGGHPSAPPLPGGSIPISQAPLLAGGKD